MDETLKAQIRAFGIGRVGLGAAAVLAPRLVTRMLLGKGHDAPATRMFARMLGARDIALGLGVVFALNHETPVRGWLEAGSVADSGDFLAAVLASRHLARSAAFVNGLASLGGAAYGRYLAGAIPPSGEGTSAAVVGTPIWDTHAVP
jgi:hypothetical protein